MKTAFGKKKLTSAIYVILGCWLLATPAASAGESWVGLGAQFWRTADGLPSGSTFDDIEDDGYSWVASYQYRPRGLFAFEVDLEYFKDGFAGTTETAYAPQAFVLVGKSLYAGVGTGVTISSGLEDDVSDPFFMGRLGYNLALLGPLDVDIHVTYRFDEWEGLEGIDVSTDTYTFGAILRLKL